MTIKKQHTPYKKVTDFNAEEAVVESTVKVAKTPKVEENDLLKQVLERLDKVEQENKELKKKDVSASIKASKERYTWPRHYSFKLIGGVPVLWWSSKKKDPTKDLVYKNNLTWAFVDNHISIVRLADGTTYETSATDFGRDYNQSEKMEAAVITSNGTITGYQFATDDFGNFIVDPYAVN